jgi:sulfonate transport system substrate-binding protein
MRKAIRKTLEPLVRGLKIATLLAALVLGAAPAALRAADPGWPETLRFATTGGTNLGKPYYTGTFGLLQDQGWLEAEFRKHGTKIEYSFFPGAGPAINEAIANHKLDLACYGDLPTIIGRAVGLKTRVLAGRGRDQRITIAVRADSGIRTLDDLKGHRVGFSKGTYSHLEFERLLDDRGLTDKDFKVFNLSGADATVALNSNDIDANLSGDWTLRAQGLQRFLFRTTSHDETAKYVGFGLVVGTEPFIAKYPGAVQAFIDQYIRASIYLTDPANKEVYFTLSNKSGVNSANTREDVGPYAIGPEINPLLGPKFIAKVQEAIDTSKRLKLIRRDFRAEDWLDRRFLDAAHEKYAKEIARYESPALWDPL